MDIINENSTLKTYASILENNSEVVKFLQERLEFYTNESDKLERALKLTHIIEENGSIRNQEMKIVETLVDVQEKFGVEEFSPAAMTMVYTQHMYDTEDISGRLQKSLNVQNEISREINEESRMVECAFVDAQKQFSDVDVKLDELENLRSQLKKYEAEISKYEQRYSWFKDSSSDILAIVGKIDDLKSLQYEESKLLQELDQYKGLQPDLVEAHQQLKELKEKYEKISSEIFHNV